MNGNLSNFIIPVKFKNIHSNKNIEKPIIKRIYRVKYRSNPNELIVVAIITFLFGLLIGALLL